VVGRPRRAKIGLERKGTRESKSGKVVEAECPVVVMCTSESGRGRGRDEDEEGEDEDDGYLKSRLGVDEERGEEICKVDNARDEECSGGMPLRRGSFAIEDKEEASAA